MGKLLFALLQFNKPEGKRWKTVLLLQNFPAAENGKYQRIKSQNMCRDGLC